MRITAAIIMKRTASIFFLIVLGLLTFVSCEKKEQDTFVDLGLTSGTKWQSVPTYNYRTFQEASQLQEGTIPTKAQFEELISECTWEWQTSSYKITGPNGKFITLYAGGKKYPRESEIADKGRLGCYWSSTEKEQGIVYYLEFTNERHEISYRSTEGYGSVCAVK